MTLVVQPALIVSQTSSHASISGSYPKGTADHIIRKSVLDSSWMQSSCML